MLVQLHINSQHYNGTREVKPVIVLSLVRNFSLLHLFLESFVTWCNFNVLYLLYIKRMQSVDNAKAWLKSKQVSNNTSHSLSR